jgi:hypothetical protein
VHATSRSAAEKPVKERRGYVPTPLPATFGENFTNRRGAGGACLLLRCGY